MDSIKNINFDIGYLFKKSLKKNYIVIIIIIFFSYTTLCHNNRVYNYKFVDYGGTERFLRWSFSYHVSETSTNTKLGYEYLTS
jgi:hypothetical protein